MSGKKSNTLPRLLLFFIGLPAVIGMIILWPEYNHPVFSLALIIVTGFAAVEANTFFRSQKLGIHSVKAWIIGALPGTITLLYNLKIINLAIAGAIGVGTISLFFLSQVFIQTKKEFDYILPRVSAGVFIMIYPGAFSSFMILIGGLKNAEGSSISMIMLLVFACGVFLNDSLAWLFGKLMGKDHKMNLLISPNKSVPGFIAGFITSIAVLVISRLIFPEVFPGSIIKAIILGAVLGLATIFGDLVESALKRSATLKDSGNIIPGRGGVLDSIDSPLFAGPLFYFLYIFMYL